MRHMQVTPQSLAPGRCSEDWVQPETHEFSQAGCSHLLLSALYGMQSFLHLTNAGVVAPNRLELPADCTHTRPLLETRDSGLGRAGRGGGAGAGRRGRGWAWGTHCCPQERLVPPISGPAGGLSRACRVAVWPHVGTLWFFAGRDVGVQKPGLGTQVGAAERAGRCPVAGGAGKKSHQQGCGATSGGLAIPESKLSAQAPGATQGGIWRSCRVTPELAHPGPGSPAHPVDSQPRVWTP